MYKDVPVKDEFPWQDTVKDKDISTPPTSPVDGDRYIVGPSPTIGWIGHTNDIAEYVEATTSWLFLTPGNGWRVHLDDEDALYKFSVDHWENTALGGMTPHALADHTDVTETSVVDQQLVEYNLDLTDYINVDSPAKTTHDPGGFDNPDDVSITFANATRTLNIIPTDTTYDIWVTGRKYTKTGTDTKAHTDTEGNWYFYYDTAGVLQTSQSKWDYMSQISVAHVYWDAVNNLGIIVSVGNHGTVLPQGVLEWMHASNKASAYESGFDIGNLTLDGDGSLDAHATFSVENGITTHADLEVASIDGTTQEMSPVLKIPILYLDGADGDLRRQAPGDFAAKIGTTGIQYNNWTGTTWETTDATDGYYVATFVYASTNRTSDGAVIGVLGQEEYATIADALERAIVKNLSVDKEDIGCYVHLYTVLMLKNSAYTNTPSAVIRHIIPMYVAEDENNLDYLKNLHIPWTVQQGYSNSNSPYIENNSATWQTVGRIIFPGSALKPFLICKILASRSGAAGIAEFRIVETLNQTVEIAYITWIDAIEGIYTEEQISNLPEGEVMWDVQIKKQLSNHSSAQLSYLLMY